VLIAALAGAAAVIALHTDSGTKLMRNCGEYLSKVVSKALKS
jgi:hypothetical protein